ncbi:hypothetical protein I317_01990 [Kwoniella heveanensis CBS 569]|nr:hypothetical protein I317_01990 [Kwoniella heveanensis CBS 569]
MGRKKIEIRPLVDERNRNVTFLKRKAGLMKKAWELSVLCAADVSIVIFSAAGKAYEFSSKELESELDRYYDYEGMIERRRAPEFAAMALAGEDDEDDDDEAGPSRRDSVSKGKNNTAAPAAAVANGGPAQPRSLKGKETFKAKTVRHGHESSGRRKGKKKRSKSRSSSEKRSFIDSILSGESGEESDTDDREEDARRRRKEDQQYEKERRREKERERKARRDSDIDRSKDREVERAYGTSDKMMAGLQYALSMHSAPAANMNNDPRHASQYAGPSREPFAREHQVNTADVYSNHPASMPVTVNVPQLPRLPSDGAAYRLPHSLGYGNAPQLPQGLTYSPGLPPSSAQYMQTHPHSHSIPQDGLHPSLSASAAGFAATSAGGLPLTAPPGFQWDQNLIARYAEFQLQQNHQRQQRVLLEKQRQQLAHLGVPLDDRSLLDEIFGGMSSSGNGGGGGSGGSIGGNAGRGEYIPMEDTQNNSAGSGEFIWPLAGSSAGGGGGNNRPSTMGTPLDESPAGAGGYDFHSHSHSQSQSIGNGPAHSHGQIQPGMNGNGNGNGNAHGQSGHGDWSFEVFDQQGDGRDGMSLPSPVSASNGEVRRIKGRGRDYEEEGISKRMRVI